MNESISVSSDADVQWGVQVELGNILVVKDTKSSGKFTTFTFRFRIGQSVHEFTSRYSRLYKFQEALSKQETFQKAFKYDPPPFPSKSYFTDYTKPKNYKKRAKKLEEWFKQLLLKPTILRNHVFQKGIDLNKPLQDKMTEIAIDLGNRDVILKTYDRKKGKHKRRPVGDGRAFHNDPRGKGRYPEPKMQNMGSSTASILDDQDGTVSNEESMTRQSGSLDADDDSKGKQPAIRKMSQQQLASFLSALQHETEQDLIDVTFEQENMAIHSGIYDAAKIEAAKCFYLSEVLPSFLMPNDPFRDEPFPENAQRINAELLRMMDSGHRREREEHLEAVDKSAYEIRDLILSNCLLKQ